ncbi:hypothetical protein F5050DRAFT_1170296 [Lentinula boryana]|uniref:Uncharacterized protein n=1 Tax=Lentinula boryana TaxID=40481 RepID=A0ABQ8QJU0_9AGAR|nr:hypothetical protein F5050DRAFT_1170296 [Lentinula boryana]
MFRKSTHQPSLCVGIILRAFLLCPWWLLDAYLTLPQIVHIYIFQCVSSRYPFGVLLTPDILFGYGTTNVYTYKPDDQPVISLQPYKLSTPFRRTSKILQPQYILLEVRHLCIFNRVGFAVLWHSKFNSHAMAWPTSSFKFQSDSREKRTAIRKCYGHDGVFCLGERYLTGIWLNIIWRKFSYILGVVCEQGRLRLTSICTGSIRCHISMNDGNRSLYCRL